MPDREQRPPGCRRDDEPSHRGLARRAQPRRRGPAGLAQRDRDRRQRGAQERGPDAPPAGRRRAPAPSLRGRRRRGLRRPHRHRGPRADDPRPARRRPVGAAGRLWRPVRCRRLDGGAAPGLGHAGRQPGFSLEGLIDRLWEAMPHRPPVRQGAGAAHLASARRSAGPPSAPWPSWPSSSCSASSSSSCLGAATPRPSSASPAAIRRSRWRSTAPSAPDNLLATEPEAALEYYREAWTEIVRARATGLSAPALDELERRVRDGHRSALRRAHAGARDDRRAASTGPTPSTSSRTRARARSTSTEPSPASSASTRPTASRTRSSSKATSLRPGATSASGSPAQLEDGGPHVVITDDEARPWRWSPSNSTGAGTLTRLTLQGSPTFARGPRRRGGLHALDRGLRLYVAEPSQNQIMRYQQTLDGSAFSEPSGYLATPSAEVADFGQLYVDFDVYALIEDTVRRYQGEKYDGAFMLAEPPDVGTCGPATTTSAWRAQARPDSGGQPLRLRRRPRPHRGLRQGRRQLPRPVAPGRRTAPQMDDLRGMYVIPGKVVKKRRRRRAGPTRSCG